MTALQVIIKEAKAIRSKSPKMEWKKAVAQASAIYAKKHKGKSPVGKKKAVKKADKKVGTVKKKAAKKKIGKIDPNKAFKKQMQVSKSVNTKYKNWEYPVPPVYTGNWSVTTWGEWIRKHGRKIGAIKKHDIKKKAVKKTATKKASSMHKDTKSHNVNIRVMSGVGAMAIEKYKKAQNDIISLENALQRNLVQMKLYPYKNPFWRQKFAVSNAKLKAMIKELKIHSKELKKSI